MQERPPLAEMLLAMRSMYFSKFFGGVLAEDYFGVAGAVELDVGIISIGLGGADVAEKHGAIDGVDERASAAVIGGIKTEGFFGQAGRDEGLDMR